VYLDSTVEENEIFKLGFYSATSGYVAFRDWIGYTTDSGRTFIKKYITPGNVNYNGYTVNLTFGFGINGVKAFNRDSLIAYGHYGFVPAILYSTDGANTFKLVFQSQYNPTQFNTGVMDMVFPENNNIGYAVDADRILKTTDRGVNWSSVRNDPSSFFNHLDAIDNNNLIAYSTDFTGNKLLKTSNAGVSWQQITIPLSQKISAADFLTASKGWIATRDVNNSSGNIYYTSNQGGTWSQKNDAEVSSFYTERMVFVNDGTGYALGDLFEVYKTTDSGKVWERLPRDNAFTYLGYSLNDIQIFNSTQFWAGGGHGYLSLSTNAGGNTLPTAFFKVDTTNVYSTNTVKLLNFSKPGYQYSWFVNNVFVSSQYNASYTHVLASEMDSIKLIVTKGGISDTLVKYQRFNVPELPVITSFEPATGSTGTLITINGNNFTNISGVRFGGVAAASFTVESPTKITAIVGSGATGNVSLTSVYGTFSRPGFTYYVPPSLSPPTITSLSPSSGIVGTAVTITGTNFDPLSANNVVYFGATRATVTSASATQITCTVPAGASYIPVSVLNTTSHLSGHSLKPFNVVFADSSNFTANSFSEVFKLPLPPNYFASYTEGRDMDGDGKPDIISRVAVFGFDTLSAFRNTSANGVLSFAAKQSFLNFPGGLTGNFAINDLDGDGMPDLVSVTNRTSLNAFRNTSVPGSISLSAPLSIPTSNGSTDVKTADLDNDGRPDIAATGYFDSKLSVVRNTSVPGALSFAARTEYLSGGNAVALSIGDLDGDGWKDIICLNYLSLDIVNNISIFRNQSAVGNLSFATKVDMNYPGTARAGQGLFLADYDGDNKLDILLLNDSYYLIFRNNSTLGNISFDPAVSLELVLGQQGGCVANLSGDAKPDFLAGRSGGGNLSVFRNLSVPGSILNASPVDIAYDQSYYTNSADFNLDGKADIVLSSTQGISILKNTMGVQIPFSVCANDYTTITADLTGKSFQWQQDSGSGFVNIADNNNFSGTQTSALNFAKVPLTWNGFKYRVIVDGATSSTFVIKVKGFLAPSVTVSTPATSICSGASATFTATGTNGGDDPYYIWKINGLTVGNNTNVFTSSSLKDKDELSVVLISSEYCSNFPSDTSDIITMRVNGGEPAVSIAPASLQFCEGSPAAFTAKAVNAGENAVYQWQVNGVNAGSNSETFSSTQVKSGDKIKLILTQSASSCGSKPSVESNLLTVNVSPIVAPSVTIVASDTSICAGMEVWFTAAPVHGGSYPTYQWKINGVNVSGGDQRFFAPSLSNNDKVQVTLTSNAGCISQNTAVSNVITMKVSGTTITPAVTIAAPTTTICAGSPLTFTATPVNGGTTPSYQWKLNGLDVGSNSPTYTVANLASDARVVVLMTSNVRCASPSTVNSNLVSITVNTAIANAGEDQTICSGNSTEIGILPNPGHSYSWSPSTGLSSTTIAKPTASPLTTTNYILTATTVSGCVSKDTVMLTVKPLPAAPVITQVGNVLSSPYASGNQWFKDGSAIVGATGQTYTATTTGLYSAAVIVNGCLSPLSNTIGFVVTGVNTTLTSEGIVIGPSPVRDRLFVEYKGNGTGVWQLQLIDLNGHVVAQNTFTSSCEIDMTRFTSGYYIARVTNLKSHRQAGKMILKL
jgi:hypothetical protein